MSLEYINYILCNNVLTKDSPASRSTHYEIEVGAWTHQSIAFIWLEVSIAFLNCANFFHKPAYNEQGRIPFDTSAIWTLLVEATWHNGLSD